MLELFMRRALASLVLLIIPLVLSNATPLAIGQDHPVGQVQPRMGRRVVPLPPDLDLTFVQMARPVSAFSPDGKLLAWMEDPTHLVIRDAVTGTKLQRLECPDDSRIRMLSFSPNGKTLAGGDWLGRVYLWRVVSAKLVRNYRPYQFNLDSLAFSEDGSTLACSSSSEATIGRLDVATGVITARLPIKQESIDSLCYSPDGGSLAVAGSTVRLWDFTSGTFVRNYDAQGASIVALAYSPDGKMLVGLDRGGRIQIWDASTGKALNLPLPLPQRVSCFAFSPDGRSLLIGSSQGEVAVIELMTGGLRNRLVESAMPVAGVSFLPEERRLVAVFRDGLCRNWPALPAVGLLSAKAGLTPARMWSSWESLAELDPATAFRAAAQFISMPDHSLAFVRERLLGPSAQRTRERIDRLIVDLDSDVFRVRQRASQELESLGRLAESRLRIVLNSSPSPEVRHRVELLLENLSGPVKSEQWRMTRVLEILEAIGDAESRQILEALAVGDRDRPAVEEARASLERVVRRGRQRRASVGGSP